MEQTSPSRVRKYRWLIWCVVTVVILTGSLLYGFGRAGGVSRSEALTGCDIPVSNSASATVRNIQPAVVGLGNSESLAAADTSIGWRWCYVEGGGTITSAQRQVPLAAIAAIHDGGLQSDVLMLVHLTAPTVSVVVTTASSRSFVLSHGGGYQVLRIPIAKWPQWHVPFSRVPVALGRIIGFDSEGRVTASQVFTWCPGVLNTTPGTGC